MIKERRTKDSIILEFQIEMPLEAGQEFVDKIKKIVEKFKVSKK